MIIVDLPVRRSAAIAATGFVRHHHATKGAYSLCASMRSAARQNGVLQRPDGATGLAACWRANLAAWLGDLRSRLLRIGGDSAARRLRGSRRWLASVAHVGGAVTRLDGRQGSSVGDAAWRGGTAWRRLDGGAQKKKT